MKMHGMCSGRIIGDYQADRRVAPKVVDIPLLGSVSSGTPEIGLGVSSNIQDRVGKRYYPLLQEAGQDCYS